MKPLPAWLDGLRQSASAALSAGRLGHALLIHGPPGWGELLLANDLALHLLEQESRQEAATLAHPDLRWLAPEGPGNQIKIDSIRAVSEFAVQTPQIAARKVIVVASAERMNAFAANALLKTLEEPPGASYLILTTAALAELLPTIRSRCQLMAIRPPSLDVARDWISAQAGELDPDSVDRLAFEYGYAAIDVLAAIQREEQPLFEALLDVGAGRTSAVKLADQWSRQDVDSLLARWMRYVHALLQPNGSRAAAGANVAPFSALNGNPGRAFYLALVEARSAVRSPSNPNRQQLLEPLLIRWRDALHGERESA